MNNLRFTNPWFLSVQGVVMIVLGLIALINPELTLKAIVQFIGILFLMGGIFLIILNKKGASNRSEFWFYEGILNSIIGLLFLIFPSFVVNLFVIILGIIALVMGIINLNFILKIRPYYFWLSLLRSVILILFGLLFLFVPFQGAVVIVNIIGFVSLFYGIISLLTAYKFYQLNQSDF
ncbi:MAG: HdeD family acid-resistance protein [Bacteroidales bacterium]